MSDNDYYKRTKEFDPRTRANGLDVEFELDAISAAFDKIPAPREDGQGYDGPIHVGAATAPTHAVQLQQMEAKLGDNTENANRAEEAAERAEEARDIAIEKARQSGEARDEALEAAATVTNIHREQLEKALGMNARVYPRLTNQNLKVGDVIPAPEDTADGLPITHVIVDGNAYAMSPIASGLVSDLTASVATIGGISVDIRPISSTWVSGGISIKNTPYIYYPSNSALPIIVYDKVGGNLMGDEPHFVTDGGPFTTEKIERLREECWIEGFGAKSGLIADNALEQALAQSKLTGIPVKAGAGQWNFTRTNFDYNGNGIFGAGREVTFFNSLGDGALFKNNFRVHKNKIKDITFVGPGESFVNSKLIGAEGGDQGFFRTQIENVDIDSFHTGIEFEKSLNILLSSVFIVRCVRGLYFVGGGSGWNNTWWNNCVTLMNCKISLCSDVAVDYVGSNLSFAGTNNIEKCGTGVRLKRNSGFPSDLNTLDNIYFEFNTYADIDAEDCSFTIGKTIHQAKVEGAVTTPIYTLHAKNCKITRTGRPVYRDGGGVYRTYLINNTTLTSLHDDITSNRDYADETSQVVYVTTRLLDQRKTQSFTNLSTTNQAIGAAFGTSARQVNHQINWILEDHLGNWVMFTTYGGKIGSSFKTTAVSGNASLVTDGVFEVSLAGITYTFTTTGSDGTLSIKSSEAISGVTKLTSKIVNSRLEDYLS
ncbi:TPA: hypothetical protein VGT23_001327 [Vibrio cholerae]|nr:hypothetical protein [Vibrio cholerae]HEQ3577763.1 hypothetical protein [Vibrio cholerae]